MKQWQKVLICAAAAVALCAGLVGAYFWYRSPQPIPVPTADGLTSVNIMVVEDGRDETWSPEITPEQAQEIVGCLGRYSMSRGSENKGSMHIEKPYYYVTLWLRDENGKKYNVNVSNVALHSTVQFGDLHHDVMDSDRLFAELREILDF